MLKQQAVRKRGTENMAILEMKGIKKRFSGEEILKGIDLSCKEGEVLSIIGPSGSGKSTLLRIATFLESADSGTIIYDGKTVFQRESQSESLRKEGEAIGWDTANRQQAKALFGLVFQNFNLFPHWTVLENIIAPLIHVQKKEKTYAVEKGMALLERMGLSAPQITYVMQEMKGLGLNVDTDVSTVEEAKKEILKALHSSKNIG